MQILRGWLDLETTGFTDLHEKMVYQHKILELGVAVTDEEFNILASMNFVIGHQFDDYKHLLDSKVLAMHTKNGLFDECGRSTLTLKMAECQVVEFYKDHGISSKGTPLSGNGITFDRIFMETHLPVLNDFFHYRQMDISAVKEFLKVIMPGVEPKKMLSHRALDDIKESIAEANFYRHIILNSAGIK